MQAGGARGIGSISGPRRTRGTLLDVFDGGFRPVLWSPRSGFEGVVYSLDRCRGQRTAVMPMYVMLQAAANQYPRAHVPAGHTRPRTRSYLDGRRGIREFGAPTKHRIALFGAFA